MDLGQEIDEALEFVEVFSFTLFGHRIGVTETVVVTWLVMALILIPAFLWTRRLKTVPRGAQALVESGVEFLNGFSKKQFGRRAKTYGPFIGALFLLLFMANIVPVLSPVALRLGGQFYRPGFTIKPPARDINFAAALSVLSIVIVLAGGLAARGPGGWAKKLFHPMPMMLPFNLMEYVIRPLSLCLRLFGNILGGFIIMRLVEAVVPIGIPPALGLYFDFFDGLIQALVFTFLTTLFIAEAVETETES
ncbi:MAG: F0F1 ATP synthase subunit A [Spirochaetales bacterium]|jgi:F-type H+-transporting ATPase subunit a|nr:F0F1 ATP synthase subunit A [Spirochaetales bacterium]